MRNTAAKILIIFMTLISGCGGNSTQLNSSPPNTANQQTAPRQRENSAVQMLVVGDTWSFTAKDGSIKILVESKNSLIVSIRNPDMDIKQQSCNIAATENKISCKLLGVNNATVNMQLDYVAFRKRYYATIFKTNGIPREPVLLDRNTPTFVDSGNAKNVPAKPEAKTITPTVIIQSSGAAMSKSRSDLSDLIILDHKRSGHYVTGRVMNKTSRNLSTVIIEFDCFNRSRALVGNGYDVAYNLESGGVWKFNAYMPNGATEYRNIKVIGH
ncbi:MAG: FxLYD domain-containing protein [Negativicutes bacterium]